MPHSTSIKHEGKYSANCNGNQVSSCVERWPVFHLVRESKTQGRPSEMNECLQFYHRQVNLVSRTQEKVCKHSLRAFRKSTDFLKNHILRTLSDWLTWFSHNSPNYNESSIVLTKPSSLLCLKFPSEATNYLFCLCC